MAQLEMIAKFQGVKGAVLGDLDGAFLDAVREPNGESIAAEMGFLSSSLKEAGESLGLGILGTVSLAGPVRASLVVVRGQSVITARVEPVKALPLVEKSVETSFQELT
jgi:predicted regulator of Ras-like GTPase activity (Roadblock/LC7/MglB family)